MLVLLLISLLYCLVLRVQNCFRFILVFFSWTKLKSGANAISFIVVTVDMEQNHSLSCYIRAYAHQSNKVLFVSAGNWPEFYLKLSKFSIIFPRFKRWVSIFYVVFISRVLYHIYWFTLDGITGFTAINTIKITRQKFKFKFQTSEPFGQAFFLPSFILCWKQTEGEREIE